MRPKSIHGECNCDVSIEPLQSETYTKEVTIRRDEYTKQFSRVFSIYHLAGHDVRLKGYRVLIAHDIEYLRCMSVNEDIGREFG